MRRTIRSVLVFGCCLILAGCDDGGPPPGRGTPAGAPPAARTTSGTMFSLPGADGRKVAVHKPAALFFFTSWCSYCKQVMPEVNQLADRARRKGWKVYGIMVGEGPDKADEFIQRYQPNFPVLLDTTSVVADQFSLRGYPTFIVIDGNGNIIHNANEPPRNF
ncbi:MAG: TlpA family protein disulfide reductase [Planctomycetes bacterium]|nr:TlpA family protein disulfide reductase [Planctomycetota bacterium]